MRYKINNKVRIKTWKEMKEEYGLDFNRDIKCEYGFLKDMEERLNKLNTNRVLTIKEIKNNYYYMKEMGNWWSNEMIECLAKDYKNPEQINSRFEILDIR